MKLKIKRILLALVFVLTIAACFLPVEASAKTIKLDKKSVTIKVKKTVKLKVKGTSKTVKWSSSKKSVATVNQEGKVIAKKPGTTTITAKVGKRKLKCKVKVVKASSKKSKEKTLYSEFLKRSTVKGKDGSYEYTITLKNCYFTVIDLNGDKVKELIVKEKGGLYGPCMTGIEVFTIKNGKVVSAGSTSCQDDFSNVVSVSRIGHYLYGTGHTYDEQEEVFYSVENGKLVSKKDYKMHYEYDYYEAYYIDGREVSKETYVNDKSKYVNDMDKYTLHKNTTANRKKYLK